MGCELASGLHGEGRMAEPEQILDFITTNFFLTRPLEGKKAIVTAGPTYEPIDPVRFIGNNSSGKMGLAIAKELHHRGADVTLIMGPSQLDITANGITVVKVKTADEMYRATNDAFQQTDIAVMAAAVADYMEEQVSSKKIKKKEEKFTIELKKTTDILKALGEKKSSKQVIVGFALETEQEKEYAIDKLTRKNADLIIMNSLKDPGAGFGHDTNKITIFDRDGEELVFGLRPKTEVAKDIVETIIRKFYA